MFDTHHHPQPYPLSPKNVVFAVKAESLYFGQAYRHAFELLSCWSSLSRPPLLQHSQICLLESNKPMGNLFQLLMETKESGVGDIHSSSILCHRA